MATVISGYFLPFYLYMTPGRTHNISNNILAPTKAVVPVVSQGGETYNENKETNSNSILYNY